MDQETKQVFQKKPGGRSKLIIYLAVLVGLLAIGGILFYQFYWRYTGTTEAVTAAGRNQITIGKDGFNPKSLVVSPGTSVTWTNTDVANHTVIFKDFGSAEMAPQDIWPHLFEKKGIFEYTDKDGHLKGKIVVK